MSTMDCAPFGIDVSARWFDVAAGPAATDVQRFANTPDGIRACVSWLAGVAGAGRPVRVGMEATGTYSLPLATALHAAGHTVYVCNPLSLARYGQAMLARTKTDALDARRIARFCAAHELAPWSPSSAAHQQLHALVSTREVLVGQAQRLRNRQHAADYTSCPALVADLQAPVLAAITAQIAAIERELATLAKADTPLGAQLRVVQSVPGLGLTTAATLVSGLPLHRLAGPRQVASYVGLCPRERSSGSSVRGRSSIGSLGPAHLRRALYLPAVVAMRANPELRTFAERLRTRGKPPKVIVVAVMRKLLLLAWALLQSGQPYAPAHRPAAAVRQGDGHAHTVPRPLSA